MHDLNEAISVAAKRKLRKEKEAKETDILHQVQEGGVAFRGNDKLLGSPHNSNYLGIL